MVTRTQLLVFTVLSSLTMLIVTPYAHAITPLLPHAQHTPSLTATLPTPALTEADHTTHNWITGHSADPYTGQTYPYASLVSSTTAQTSAAVLTLRCSRYQTMVSVYWGQPITGESMKVRYTVSHAKNSTQENWIVSTHSPTLVYPHDGNRLFADLLTSSTLTLEAFPENAPTLQASFSTRGADTALKELIMVCGE